MNRLLKKRGRNPSSIQVVLLLPTQIDCGNQFRLDHLSNDSTNVLNLFLWIRPSRVLWSTVHPLLFQSDSIAHRALECILIGCFHWDQWMEKLIIQQQQPHVRNYKNNTTVLHTFASPTDSDPEYIQKRTFQVSTVHAIQYESIYIWIQPPNTIQLDYIFAGHLIRLEHRFIQAQSLAGYMATLGGGFFLCHHFQTAIILAEQQQRLAVLLNDERMYYACAINKAFSCLYNGRFRLAKNILRQVSQSIQRPKSSLNGTSTRPPDPVLLNMYHSAILLCKRMENAKSMHTLLDTTNAGIVLNERKLGIVDDFQRIRVVDDKSKRNDLVVPFSKLLET